MISEQKKQNENEIIDLESISLLKPLFIYGYAYNLKQPCLLTKLQSPAIDLTKINMLWDQFLLNYKNERHSVKEKKIRNIVDLLIGLSTLILRKYNHPALSDPSVIQTQKTLSDEWTIILPCINHESYWIGMKCSLNIIKSCLNDKQNQSSIASIIQNHDKAINKILLKSGLKGFNREHFLIAAKELNIPWVQINSDLFQFGFGSASRLLDSSFTDRTSNISATLARNKIKTAQILRKVGVPVPPHFLASTEINAIEIAKKLGYPVVVKPSNLDGGAGVMAYLNTEEALKKAYIRAKKLSKTVLIEKHIFGNDYRIQIVNNSIHGVIERTPGGIVADGKHSIRELLHIQNVTRKEAKDDRRYLHEIKEDDEACEMLISQSLEWESIPEKETYVRLRGASNVSSGGVPSPLSIHDIHPDNSNLALRAARVLRLDVAGVDIIIPDIRISWLESHAAICEVNAQPQMFSTMHRPMLQSLFARGTNKGRIPTIVILCPSLSSRIYNPIFEKLKNKFKNVGLSTKNGVWINDQCIIKKEIDSFSAARALIFDSSVDSILLCIEDYEPLIKGWPVDQCDILVIPSTEEIKEDNAESQINLIKFSQYLASKKIIIDSRYTSTVNNFKNLKNTDLKIIKQSSQTYPNKNDNLLAEIKVALDNLFP
jgi:cyanophycin synthetase